MTMDRNEMLRLFEAHREAEAARDIDAILETFVAHPFLETMPLGLRNEGRDAVRAAYELQFFTAFPDLAPEDEGMAVGDDVIAGWGSLQAGGPSPWRSPTSSRSARGSWPARRSTSTSPRCASRRGFRLKRSGRPRPHVDVGRPLLRRRPERMRSRPMSDFAPGHRPGPCACHALPRSRR